MQENFKYYIDNKAELIKKYKGKYLVIHSCKVVKAFSDKFDAVTFAQSSFKPKTFIVQKAVEDAETEVYHSRVIFAA